MQCIQTSVLGINNHKFPCGHANFIITTYPKYTKLQPICYNKRNNIIFGIDCDHSSSKPYFYLALDPENKFIGIRKGCSENCTDYENIDIIGIYSDRKHGFFNVIPQNIFITNPHLGFEP